jgi:LacI family transcriptional regulator, galactose operon repressor
VLDAAADLDFQPNMLARGLVTARTQVLGVIVHDVSDPYFGEILRGLEDAANLNDHRVFVCSSDREPERELGYVRSLLGHRVDAIVFAGGAIEDRRYKADLRRLLNAFRDLGGVVVMLAPHSYQAPSVTIDNLAGAREMTRYLLDLGHRRIGFIAGPEKLRTSRIRQTGYRSALREAGVEFAPDAVEVGAFTTDGGAKAGAALMERRPDITAIFAANDVMAFGVLHALAGLGLQVPEEVSVAGFDDVQLAAFAMSPLTTLRVPMSELGRLGAQIALDALAGRRVRSQRLPTEIIVRASTRALEGGH